MLTSDIVAKLLKCKVHPPSTAAPPAEHGFYAWWCRTECLIQAVPPIPWEHRPPVSARWSLLYVGISPSGPNTSRNIAIRFTKDHTGGNIGSSTFRQSVASLYLQALELQPRIGSDRTRLISETRLSQWIEASCGVTFAAADRPWDKEAEIISLLNPPLNLDHKGTHTFRFEVRARRAALARACKLKTCVEVR